MFYTLRQEHSGRCEDQQGASVTVTVREMDRGGACLKISALTLCKMECWAFPGAAVVKTLNFYYRAHRFNAWSEN